jgi:site-specific DNA-methyltransferase (adenine-specific)
MPRLQAPRRKPGQIRDAIFDFLGSERPEATVAEIRQAVAERIKGELAESSVRSYLRLNTPTEFQRTKPGTYRLRNAGTRDTAPRRPEEQAAPQPVYAYGRARLYAADCVQWLAAQSENSVHAIVTDPPYGLVEYSAEQQAKLRSRKGGVWRIPPSFDGHQRSPLPRFTVLMPEDVERIYRFFLEWAKACRRVLVPGAHVAVASNPLLSHRVSAALADAGLERRGEIVRLTMTLRGGDRPKNAHEEFPDVSVMARSMWEPWLLFRKPFAGRVQDNLRRWKTGGLRRPSPDKPFGDVIASHPTRAQERKLAPHPSLKPQSFLRTLVRAMLPLGEGVILDPFAGSGSTLAAAEAVGYESVGVEKDPHYVEMAKSAIPKLHRLRSGGADGTPSSDETDLFPRG